MTRRLSLLALLALAGWTIRSWSADAGSDIYRWTDHDGVIHFSDTPPAPAPDPDPAPIALDESTPIPATLNELIEWTSPDGRSDLEGGSDLPIAIRPNGGSDLPIAIRLNPDGTQGPYLAPHPSGATPEELDALDPVWFRGSSADAESQYYVDEHGPFTIGGPFEETRLPPEVRCRAARRDLEVLRDAWPVYRDQSGRLRFQWARDPYRGARRYLEESARATALAGIQQTLHRDCTVPDDPQAQAAARSELLGAALCEAERGELAALESLGRDTPASALSEKRTLVSEVCREPVAG